MEMLGAIVLVFALQKIAALLSIPVILGMIWVKGKASRMDGEAWEQYFRQVSNRQYVVFLLVSYGIPLLLLSALGYCLYDFLSLTDPLILASLTFLFGIFHMTGNWMITNESYGRNLENWDDEKEEAQRQSLRLFFDKMQN